MKALSIRQPYAWAILFAGKDIENRDWSDQNPALRFRGPFLIHASAGMTKREYEEFTWIDLPVKVPAFNDLQRGGIVGRARVVDVVREYRSRWFNGPIGLVLADVQPIPFIPFKGMLGFFDVPDEHVKSVLDIFKPLPEDEAKLLREYGP